MLSLTPHPVYLWTCLSVSCLRCSLAIPGSLFPLALALSWPRLGRSPLAVGLCLTAGIASNSLSVHTSPRPATPRLPQSPESLWQQRPGREACGVCRPRGVFPSGDSEGSEHVWPRAAHRTAKGEVGVALRDGAAMPVRLHIQVSHTGSLHSAQPCRVSRRASAPPRRERLRRCFGGSRMLVTEGCDGSSCITGIISHTCTCVYHAHTHSTGVHTQTSHVHP